jgi:hypothetical protein
LISSHAHATIPQNVILSTSETRVKNLVFRDQIVFPQEKRDPSVNLTGNIARSVNLTGNIARQTPSG